MMKNKTDKKGHLYFVGLGLIPREHVTIESLVALSGCDRIFAIDLTKDDIQLITQYRGIATKNARTYRPEAFSFLFCSF
jgi:precorrin-2 methylase